MSCTKKYSTDDRLTAKSALQFLIKVLHEIYLHSLKN